MAQTSAPARYVAVLALLSATLAVVLRHTLFPFLSINNDEGIYLLHAQTLADGHLFPSAPHGARSYLPWLATVVDGHYVLKYTPFVPAIFALGLALTGSIDPALVVIVGSAVVVTYLTGVELSGNRRVAAAAATLFACSPLVILQSAMVLSYLPALVLMQLSVLGVLRGTRLRRRVPVVVAGLALGIAAAVRPYDVVLLLAPLAIWLAVTAAGQRLWLLRWLLCGLAVPAAIVLVTNAAATGNPLRLPFALLEPDDKLGFGVRRLYPGDGAHDFGLVQGLQSVGEHLWLLGGWACGGVVLAVCAIAAAIRRRLAAPAAMLGVGGLLFLLGYLGFWGGWNAAQLWGGIRYVGPFYMVPVLIPVVHLGAQGAADLAGALVAWRRRWGLAAVGAVSAGIVGLTAFVLVGAVGANITLTGHDRDLKAMVGRLPADPVVLVSTNPLFLGHPSAVVSNPPALDGPALFAVSRGGDDLTVVADHPDRPAYLLRFASAYNRSPTSPSTARVERLAVRTGKEVTVTVSADRAPAGSRAARLVFTAGNRRLSVPIDPRRAATMTVTVDADGLGLNDITRPAKPSGGSKPLGSPKASTVRGVRGHSLTVALYATPASGRERFVDQQVLPVRVTEGRPGVTVLGSTGQVDAVGSGLRPPVRILLGDSGS